MFLFPSPRRTNQTCSSSPAKGRRMEAQARPRRGPWASERSPQMESAVDCSSFVYIPRCRRLLLKDGHLHLSHFKGTSGAL